VWELLGSARAMEQAVACKRALDIGAHSYKSVESILKNNLDQTVLSETSPLTNGKGTPTSHEYIRGKHYFK